MDEEELDTPDTPFWELTGPVRILVVLLFVPHTLYTAVRSHPILLFSLILIAASIWSGGVRVGAWAPW